MLGGKQGADEVVQRFLARARDGTAIQAVLSDRERETVAMKDGEEGERREGAFGNWLRTPIAFSQFDLQGRTAHTTRAPETVTNATTTTPDSNVTSNVKEQKS